MCSKFANYSSSVVNPIEGPIRSFEKKEGLYFDNEQELQELGGKWLWPQFGFANHLILEEVGAEVKVFVLSPLT